MSLSVTTSKQKESAIRISKNVHFQKRSSSLDLGCIRVRCCLLLKYRIIEDNVREGITCAFSESGTKDFGIRSEGSRNDSENYQSLCRLTKY